MDGLCIERHIVCALHVIDPELFVCFWEVVDADVWGWARVQMTGWSILKETHTEPTAVAIRHGHVPSCGVDDIASAIGGVFFGRRGSSVRQGDW